MRSLIAVILLLCLSGVSAATAQQTPDPALMRTDCDCPDMDIALLLDREIASIEQKLIRVGQGLTEDESGLPNSPVLLLAMRDEARMLREAWLRDIASCRRMCRRYPGADPTSPERAFTGASAACRTCQPADARLSAAETALANHLNEMENFRRHNRIRERDGVNVADFAERLAAYQAAEARLNERLQRHQELLDAAQAAEDRVGNIAILEEWEGEDEHMNLFEFMAGMAHGFGSAAGGFFDYVIQTGRNDNLPIPDQIYISRIGAYWSAKRHARWYHDDYVVPAERAFSAAARVLPDMREAQAADSDEWPGSTHWDNVLEVLARYERDLQPLITERDEAHNDLVSCNVRICRPTPDVSDLWGEDGLYTPMSLEERFPDLPPDPADEPDNGEGLLTGDDFEGPDLSGADEFADGADGMGLPDEMAPASPPDLPVAPELPAKTRVALEATAAAMPASSGPCDISAEMVCRHLADTGSEDCEARVEDLAARCVDFQAEAFVSMGRVQSCRRSCEYSQDSTQTQFWLLDTVLDTLDTRFDGALAERDQRETDALARIERARSEIARLEGLRVERRVQIYRNTQTGEIIQEADAYFEPSPPLEHLGDMGGRLTAEEREALSQRRSELLFTEALLATIPSRETYINWHGRARSSWTGGDGFSPMMACDSGDVADLTNACLDACDAAGETQAGARSICQPAGVIGRLNLPGTSSQFIPPVDD